MMRQNVTEAEWLDHKRRSLIDLARDAGVHVSERAQSYMLANRARELVGAGK